ncbi:MAG: hypothetical protein PUD93_11565 [Lachnospiraceae bacterium]|nr:hypothetical protein [Lachnospiraceae bacterium]
MSQIVYDARKIKAYDGLVRLCDYAGKDKAWCNELWMLFLTDAELYEEFVYYLEHHGFADHMRIEGYSLTDCYVWQMEKYNLTRDLGKNPVDCNKEELALQAFMTMARLKQNPEQYQQKFMRGFGLDR